MGSPEIPSSVNRHAALHEKLQNTQVHSNKTITRIKHGNLETKTYSNKVAALWSYAKSKLAHIGDKNYQIGLGKQGYKVALKQVHKEFQALYRDVKNQLAQKPGIDTLKKIQKENQLGLENTQNISVKVFGRGNLRKTSEGEALDDIWSEFHFLMQNLRKDLSVYDLLVKNISHSGKTLSPDNFEKTVEQSLKELDKIENQIKETATNWHVNSKDTTDLLQRVNHQREEIKKTIQEKISQELDVLFKAVDAWDSSTSQQTIEEGIKKFANLESKQEFFKKHLPEGDFERGMKAARETFKEALNKIQEQLQTAFTKKEEEFETFKTTFDHEVEKGENKKTLIRQNLSKAEVENSEPPLHRLLYLFVRHLATDTKDPKVIEEMRNLADELHILPKELNDLEGLELALAAKLEAFSLPSVSEKEIEDYEMRVRKHEQQKGEAQEVKLNASEIKDQQRVTADLQKQVLNAPVSKAKNVLKAIYMQKDFPVNLQMNPFKATPRMADPLQEEGLYYERALSQARRGLGEDYSAAVLEPTLRELGQALQDYRGLAQRKDALRETAQNKAVFTKGAQGFGMTGTQLREKILREHDVTLKAFQGHFPSAQEVLTLYQAKGSNQEKLGSLHDVLVIYEERLSYENQVGQREAREALKSVFRSANELLASQTSQRELEKQQAFLEAELSENRSRLAEIQSQFKPVTDGSA